ncbi:MAG: carbohydrate binding family 9 domain-containing protein, partial [Acidobacteria bacterium]|nr:carbohydrate binding family 9 domain-containing protein [Acidobacteriota bacterium]
MPRVSVAALLRSTLLVVTAAGPGTAQSLQMAPPSGSVDRPSAQAVRVPEGPALDGEILDDPVWAAAPVIGNFVQYQPSEGQPVSENTEVRMIFTRDMLYIGVVCYDRDPSGIIVADSRRDTSLDNTDSFRMIFDTFRDRQNGFVFGTNPAGIEYDGQVTNEGVGGGGLSTAQMSGSGGGFNLNWDGAWEVRAKTTEIGWMAEFAIPFKTLRYPEGSEQSWGVNFQRNIRRKNEQAFWAQIPRQFNINRVSLAGTIANIEPPVFRNFKVIPYMLGQFNKTGVRPVDGVALGEVGADAKYNLTPSLTLDATYNTDFAQVEVDDQQVNLDRFNLFFPEKRPFFLENAGFFSVGNPGEVDLFFSRRIGLSNSGQAIPLYGGGRVSGKVGLWNVGLLNMQTKEVGAFDTPGNNFGVIRLMRELPNRTAIGGLFVNRQGTGDLVRRNAEGDNVDYNRTFAIDGKLGIGRSHQIT